MVNNLPAKPFLTSPKEELAGSLARCALCYYYNNFSSIITSSSASGLGGRERGRRGLMVMAGIETGAHSSIAHRGDCQTSEEDSGSDKSQLKIHNKQSRALEIARKPRGRPPGSKNKAKPPIFVTDENVMRPHVIEIAGGCDIADCLSQFALRRKVGLCVLSGSGTVANVTIRQASSPGAIVTFHGRFEILSLSGSYVPKSSGGLAISLAASQGQVVGGNVVGVLAAAGPVRVIASSFVDPSYHRLPSELEDDSATANALQHHRPPPPPPINGYPPPADSSGVTMYSVSAVNPINCHLPPDVLSWPPNSRPSY